MILCVCSVTFFPTELRVSLNFTEIILPNSVSLYSAEKNDKEHTMKSY